MDHRQLGKIRACPFVALACEMSSVPTAAVSFWRCGLFASCPLCEEKGVEGSTCQLVAGKRASLSNSRVDGCGIVVLKSPSWKIPWLVCFSAVVGGRSLHQQTWNLPEGWAAVVTSWLPLFPSHSPVLGGLQSNTPTSAVIPKLSGCTCFCQASTCSCGVIPY